MSIRSALSAGAVALVAAGLSACGETERVGTAPTMSSPRVAMTASYPGFAPFALVTYRDAGGLRCHGLASVTSQGPRVMGALDRSLVDGLATRGKCLRATDGDVSLQVRKAGAGSPRIVGGLVRAGVTRVVVGGQSVRPRANGEFLVVQPIDSRSTGDAVELEYRAGRHKRVSLRLLAS